MVCKIQKNHRLFAGRAIRIAVLLFVALIFLSSTVNTYASESTDSILAVCGDRAYKPYSYKENGRATGHDVELIGEIADCIGAKAEVHLLGWDTAYQGLIDGIYDIALTASYSEARSDEVIYTHPVSSNPYVVFGKEKSLVEISKLFEMKIAVQTGDAIIDDFIIPSGLIDNTETFSDIAAAFRVVETGEYDAVISSYAVGINVINDQSYSDIHEISDVVYCPQLCFAVKHDKPELAEKINGAIDSLAASGRLKELNDKWLSDYVVSGAFSRLFGNNDELIIALILGVLAISSVCFAIFQRRIASKMRYNENYDKLTGLMNQRYFCDKTKNILEHGKETDYIIIRFDINHFKIVNDLQGSAGGDRLLVRISDFLRYFVKQHSAIVSAGHIEADHFVFCCKLWGFDEKRICIGLQDEFKEYAPEYNVTFAFGLCKVVPSDDIVLSCDQALMAILSIKGMYGQTYAWYNDAMREKAKFEQELEQEMEPALVDKQFVPYFQAQYNYDTGELIGAEALVRWIHPQKGMIPPNNFIPQFEKNGFIYTLDAYIWEQTCKKMREWMDAGIEIPHFSVNISRYDLTHEDIVNRLMSIVNKYKIKPELLHLECTETAFENYGNLIESVAESLKEHGFKIEMDDFGSGYSSLNLLKSVPIDLLKMDMKFLDNGGTESKGAMILNSVVHMSHLIGIPVIAEGVETKEQANFLKSIGCFYMQGYFFAKPVSADEFVNILKTKKISTSDVRFSQNIGDATDFLEESTQSTLLFNSFLGGAGIFDYTGDKLEPLRLNDRFFKICNTTRELFAKSGAGILECLTDETRPGFIKMLNDAIATGEEVSCVTCSVRENNTTENQWYNNRARFLTKKVDGYLMYISLENITDRVKLEEKNANIIKDMDTLIQGIPGGIMCAAVGDNGLVIDFVSEGFANMLGYNRNRLISSLEREPFELIHPADRARIIDLFSSKFKQGDTFHTQYRIVCSDGIYRWYDIKGSFFGSDNDGTVYMIFSDLNEQKEMSESLSGAVSSKRKNYSVCTYAEALDLMGSVFYKIIQVNLSTNKYHIIKANLPEPNGNTEYSSFTEWIHNVICSGLVYNDDIEGMKEAVNIVGLRKYFSHKDECFRYRYRRETKIGFRWVSLEIIRCGNYDAENEMVMMYVRDIHDNYVSESEEKKVLEYHMTHDSLTNIFNRFAYVRKLSELEDEGRKIGVVFADLNGLKTVNDTRGHEEGDRFIARFARLISDVYGKDSCYRISGDEFVVIIECDGEPEFDALVKKLSKKLGSNDTMSASFGAVWSSNSGEVYSVVRKAESKMYDNKRRFYEEHPELTKR